MRRAVRLYVSASADLEAERDLVGRLVAGLPVTTGWEIGRAALPGREEDEVTVHVAPQTCDLYIFMLGQDITAPAGVEWDAAHEVQHLRPLPLETRSQLGRGTLAPRLQDSDQVVHHLPGRQPRVVRGIPVGG